jgi:predicted xylose isomerase-like sugar epimerase
MILAMLVGVVLALILAGCALVLAIEARAEARAKVGGFQFRCLEDRLKHLNGEHYRLFADFQCLVEFLGVKKIEHGARYVDIDEGGRDAQSS